MPLLHRGAMAKERICTAALQPGCSAAGCRKSPWTFSTAFKNAVTFAPHSGAKVPAPLSGSLAQQGFRGIRFHARRAAAPSRSPRPSPGESCTTKIFRHAERRCSQAAAPLCRFGGQRAWYQSDCAQYHIPFIQTDCNRARHRRLFSPAAPYGCPAQ